MTNEMTVSDVTDHVFAGQRPGPAFPYANGLDWMTFEDADRESIGDPLRRLAIVRVWLKAASGTIDLARYHSTLGYRHHRDEIEFHVDREIEFLVKTGEKR